MQSPSHIETLNMVCFIASLVCSRDGPSPHTVSHNSINCSAVSSLYLIFKSKLYYFSPILCIIKSIRFTNSNFHVFDKLEVINLFARIPYSKNQSQSNYLLDRRYNKFFVPTVQALVLIQTLPHFL